MTWNNGLKFNYSRLLLITFCLSLLSACSLQKLPFGAKEATTVEDGVKQLAEEIHQSILEKALDGDIPPVLDVAIYRIVEKQQDRSYAVSAYLKKQLGEQLSLLNHQGNKNTQGQQIGIHYLLLKQEDSQSSALENKFNSELLYSHFYQPFKKVIQQSSYPEAAAKLQANLLLSGTYGVEKGSFHLQLNIISPQSSELMATEEVFIKAAAFPRKYQSNSFPQAIERKFSPFYVQLKQREIKDAFILIDQMWQPEYTLEQQEQVRLLLVKKVDQDFRNFEATLAAQKLKVVIQALSTDWNPLYSEDHRREAQEILAAKIDDRFLEVRKKILWGNLANSLVVAKTHQMTLDFYQLLQNRALSDVPELVKRRWKKSYGEEYRKVLVQLLEQKAVVAVNDLMGDFASLKALKREKENIAFLQRPAKLKSIGLAYTLSSIQKKRVRQAETRVISIEKALSKGISVTISFIAESKKNSPLEFVCEGLFQDKDLNLKLHRTSFPHSNATCKAEKGRQVMSWPNPFQLFRTSKLKLQAREKNLLTADKTFESSLPISRELLLRLYQQKQFNLPIQGSDYSLLFKRLN
ncbi:MAG: hypothetical protein COB67_07290 [SAR324 cluster bacterium]|uniref:Lipoprotein n=1 Tax=SAR324 cluster bacterium TaxID=2024889 RepID=A0A2A4T393_9DELT|nr:MAG: hypothetical protein COB67_07290 [SAR324 cluster bacterium]